MTKNEVSFVPPDGSFTLMDYRVDKPAVGPGSSGLVPLVIKPSIQLEESGGRIPPYLGVPSILMLSKSGSFEITILSKLPSNKSLEQVTISLFLGKGAGSVNASFSLLSAGATGFGRGGVIPAANKGKEGSWDFNPRTQVRHDAELRVGMPLMLARTRRCSDGRYHSSTKLREPSKGLSPLRAFKSSHLFVIGVLIPVVLVFSGGPPRPSRSLQATFQLATDSLSGIRVEHMKVFKESYKAYKGVKISSKGTIEWRL